MSIWLRKRKNSKKKSQIFHFIIFAKKLLYNKLSIKNILKKHKAMIHYKNIKKIKLYN